MTQRNLAAILVVGSLAVAMTPMLAGCGTGANMQAVNAAVNTALAIGVSGARRSRGQCYTPCDNGTVCNEETGFCEPIPCFGICGPLERCIGDGLSARCVSDDVEPEPADGTESDDWGDDDPTSLQ